MENAEKVTSRWREALMDSTHELYQAAWLIFSDKVELDTCKKRLDDKREQVIPFLYELLDDPYLAELGAPGGGYVHETAVLLLGEWEVREALPRLLKVMENADSGDFVYDALIIALTKFGTVVIDNLLEWVKENPDFRLEIGQVLAESGKEDPRVFEAIVSWFTSPPDEDDLLDYTDFLLTLNPQKAIPSIEQVLKNAELDAELVREMRAKIKEARQNLKRGAKK